MIDESLLAVSPIDGRYVRYTKILRTIASEYGLIRYRVFVMLRYLTALATIPELGLSIDARTTGYIESLLSDFNPQDAHVIKRIETKGWESIPATNHDVKACELWIRHKLTNFGVGGLVEWVHFGSTSEDVNNLAYGLMLRDSVSAVMTPLERITQTIEEMARRYAHVAMLSRTHGQAATPTTFGKECAVFAGRLHKQMRQLGTFALTLKLNGASGNYAAMRAAFPNVDWPGFALQFIESGEFLQSGEYLKFEQNPLTTQIEPHDTYVELFDIIKRINVVLIDFAQDMWRYISDDWVVQKAVAGEVGSSAMPHKVNPIQFENAEGNLVMANGTIETMSRKLPISRLQRDLSDSTVERNFGAVFGHCLIAYENLSAGLSKISPNESKISGALMEHPEILTEAIQTILRSVGYPNAYDAMKSLARGKKIGLNDLHEFIDGLNSTYVDAATKTRLKQLRRETYIGYAAELARSV